jgi:hypothetical protein
VDPNQLMQMLMELMQQPPMDQSPGNVPDRLSPSQVPPQILNGDPMEQLMPMLMQILQQGQMMQSGQQMQNGAAGGQGAMFGGMGGRPPAGSVSPSALPF